MPVMEFLKRNVEKCQPDIIFIGSWLKELYLTKSNGSLCFNYVNLFYLPHAKRDIPYPAASAPRAERSFRATPPTSFT